MNHRMSFIFVDPVFDIDIISSLGSVAELPSWGRTGFDGGMSSLDCSKVATHRQKTITDNTVKPWMLGNNNRVLARA